MKWSNLKLSFDNDKTHLAKEDGGHNYFWLFSLITNSSFAVIHRRILIADAKYRFFFFGILHHKFTHSSQYVNL